MTILNDTHAFYENHAHDYFARTKDADMTALLGRFAELLPDGAVVLDVGCGSGRDLRWFAEHGYRAVGIDASEALCALARGYAGPEAEVRCCTIEDWTAERDGSGDRYEEDPWDPDFMYGGIWANASLLHLSEEDLFAYFRAAASRLAPGGVLFFSMKEDAGGAAGADAGPGAKIFTDGEGRFFRLFDGDDLSAVLMRTSSLSMVDSWTTPDSMGRDVVWRNVLLKRRKWLV